MSILLERPVGLSIGDFVEHYGVAVSEEMARTWLNESNVDNRKWRPKKGARYAQDMYDGLWLQDGTPIRFGKMGPDGKRRLFDGQHRLKALVRANELRRLDGKPLLTLKFIVFFDLEDETRAVTDSGIPRSFTDRAIIGTGVQYPRYIAPIGRRVMDWGRQNYIPSSGTRLDVSDVTFKGFYLEHMGPLNAAAYWGGYLNQKIGVRAMEAGLAYYVIRQACEAHHEVTDEDVAGAFFHSLATGADLKEGHPALTLRESIQRRRRDQDLKANHSLSLIISAWNAFVEERPYYSAILPRNSVVTNSTLPLPLSPNNGWTGDIFRRADS